MKSVERPGTRASRKVPSFSSSIDAMLGSPIIYAASARLGIFHAIKVDYDSKRNTDKATLARPTPLLVPQAKRGGEPQTLRYSYKGELNKIAVRLGLILDGLAAKSKDVTINNRILPARPRVQVEQTTQARSWHSTL
ncbi:unnamed protein product [Phaeothamnion confervicola]